VTVYCGDDGEPMTWDAKRGTWFCPECWRRRRDRRARRAAWELADRPMTEPERLKHVLGRLLARLDASVEAKP
jgi:hypothetical protein